MAGPRIRADPTIVDSIFNFIKELSGQNRQLLRSDRSRLDGEVVCFSFVCVASCVEENDRGLSTDEEGDDQSSTRGGDEWPVGSGG